MAFNREDLITWSELAPSFKQFLRTLASSNESIAQILNNKLGQLERIQQTMDRNAAEIAQLQQETSDLFQITNAMIVDRIFKLKTMMTLHNLADDAHVGTLNKNLDTATSGKYATGRMLLVENLPEKLKDIYDGVIDPTTATIEAPIHLGDGITNDPWNETSMTTQVKDLLQAWLDDNAFDVYADDDPKADYAIKLFSDLREELYNHENDLEAHKFNKTVYLAKDADYFLEKSYHLVLPSHDLAYTDIDHAAPTPDPYTPLADPPTTPELYVKVVELENEFFAHLLDEEAHGINTCEVLYNSSDTNQERAILATITGASSYSVDIILRDIPGVHNSESLGMTYKGLYDFLDGLDSFGDEVLYDLLREIVDCKVMLFKHYREAIPHEDDYRAGFMVYQFGKKYKEGTYVYMPGQPTNMMLVAQNTGVSGTDTPIMVSMTEQYLDTRRTLEKKVAQVEKEAFQTFLGQIDASVDKKVAVVAAMTDLWQELYNHEDGEDAHLGHTIIGLTHKTGHAYAAGERVYLRGLEYPYMLEAVAAGTTDSTLPADLDLGDPAPAPRTAPVVDKKRKADYLAKFHIEFDNHILDEDVHNASYGAVKVYKKGDYTNNDFVFVAYDPRYAFIAQSSGTTNPTGTDYGLPDY